MRANWKSPIRWTASKLKRAARHPLVLIGVMLAALLGYVTDVPARLAQLATWCESMFGPNPIYEAMASLDIGRSRRWVEAQFGVPLEDDKIRDGFRVSVYPHAEYRLVVVYLDDAVAAFAVTAKTQRFHPSFLAEDPPVTLGVSTFVNFQGQEPIRWSAEFLPKDSLYYEISFLGNRGGYHVMLLAHSSALGAETRTDDDAMSWLTEIPMEMVLDREIELTDSERAYWHDRLRRESVPNIFGISGLHLADGTPMRPLPFDLWTCLVYSGSRVRNGGLDE